MEDTYRHKGLRKKLMELIRDKGITDENVLQAIDRVPRHLFLNSSFLEFAYEDKPFPIGSGQTISQPYTVAFQTELLEIKKGEKVLEIGTGSGYQSCVLMEMGAKVYTIERQKNLYLKTKILLSSLGYKPRLISYGDGYKGLPKYAPFDKAIVTAGAPYIPDALVDQLKPGGILVIPVGEDIQVMKRIIKTDEFNYIEEEHGTFRFVPLLTDKANE
ncbi:MAG: protein-L-isoaspartate(D-aspartate) O-methyltransferase [Bacteroidales bacterium]